MVVVVVVVVHQIDGRDDGETARRLAGKGKGGLTLRRGGKASLRPATAGARGAKSGLHRTQRSSRDPGIHSFAAVLDTFHEISMRMADNIWCRICRCWVVVCERRLSCR